MKMMMSELVEKLIDEIITFECEEVLKAAKHGLIYTEPPEEEFKIATGDGVDIFGHSLTKKKQFNCNCPNCNRLIAASRLAPHLEKCMGMGRASARAASNKQTS